MALKKREKTLAIVTAALLVPVVGWYLISSWRGPLAGARTVRDDLLEEVEKKRLQVKRGRKAQDQLADFNHRSLPPDADARSLYQDWLFGLAKDVGFRGTTVDINASGQSRTVRTQSGRDRGSRNRGGAFFAPRFTVRAAATLEVLTRFLHRFESADYLHQIRSLSIKTTKGSTNLDLTIVVETLSLPDATPDAGMTVEVAGGTFDTVTRLTSDLNAALIHTGRDGKLADKAELSFAGLEGAVDFIFKAGQPLDEVRDEINRKTDETGIVARLDDDNLSLSIRTDATDPPDHFDAIAQRNLFAPDKPPPPTPPERPDAPEPPKFDPGKYAYVSAILGYSVGEPVVWLNVRTSGETLKLRQGDTFDVGDVHAEIIRISRPDRNAEIEFDGKRWLVYMGDNLRQAKPLFDEDTEPDSEEDAEPPSETTAESMAEAEEAAPTEETTEQTSEEDTEPAPETAEEAVSEDNEPAPAEETPEPASEEEDAVPAPEMTEQSVAEDDEATPAEETSESASEKEDAVPAPETAEESMAEDDEAAPAEET